MTGNEQTRTGTSGDPTSINLASTGPDGTGPDSTGPGGTGSGRGGPIGGDTAGSGPAGGGLTSGDVSGNGASGTDQEDVLPTFSEQLAEQLGGVRGVLESSIPVAIFVLVNIVGSLHLALVISVASAVTLAIYRLARRETVRNAVNGLFGIAVGAFIAWKTGSTKDFYLPGIILSGVYGVAMLASVPIGRPLVGWVWSLVAAGGSMRWREQPRMVRLFSRLTVLWALTYLVKVGIQAALFHATGAHDSGTALGVARLLLGYPPYALLLAFTAWSVRRMHAANPELAEAARPG